MDVLIRKARPFRSARRARYEKLVQERSRFTSSAEYVETEYGTR